MSLLSTATTEDGHSSLSMNVDTDNSSVPIIRTTNENRIRQNPEELRIIDSIINGAEYSRNIKLFLNYCDRKRAFKLERTELETALMTLMDLFANYYNEGLRNTDPNTRLHFTCDDFQIPESDKSTWNYKECKDMFVGKFTEYFRRIRENNLSHDGNRSVEDIMNDLQTSLKKTFDVLKNIDDKGHSWDTRSTICEGVGLYIISYIPFAPWLYHLIKRIYVCYKNNNEKFCDCKNRKHICKTNLSLYIFVDDSFTRSNYWYGITHLIFVHQLCSIFSQSYTILLVFC